MSIEVKKISKYYGSQAALQEVSLSLKEGDIVGFLGPNGAGKSTLMKIICCYLSKDEGEVNVCGLNTDKDALKIKSKIGYLAENNPLYSEMYIKEYLDFVAGIYSISKKKINEMISLTGLEREQHKKISQLSKGYKQRVGLAAALIHDPEVLILDEPTTGLDPNQLVEIRNLIKECGKNKTVLLSTHIMQEVERICNRVIVINKGQIVANEKLDQLKSNNVNLESYFQKLTQ